METGRQDLAPPANDVDEDELFQEHLAKLYFKRPHDWVPPSFEPSSRHATVWAHFRDRVRFWGFSKSFSPKLYRLLLSQGCYAERLEDPQHQGIIDVLACFCGVIESVPHAKSDRSVIKRRKGRFDSFGKAKRKSRLGTLKEICAGTLVFIISQGVCDVLREKVMTAVEMVEAMVNTLPGELVETVMRAGELHRLDWGLVVKERALVLQMNNWMADIYMPSESHGDHHFEPFHITQEVGCKPLVDPMKEGFVTMEEFNEVFKGTLHPQVMTGEGHNLEDEIARYILHRAPLTVFDEDLSKVPEEALSKAEKKRLAQGLTTAVEPGVEEEEDEEDEGEECLSRWERSDRAQACIAQKLRQCVLLMRRHLKRLTYMVLYYGRKEWPRYPVYLFGVAPKTGHLVGLQTVVVWT